MMSSVKTKLLLKGNGWWVLSFCCVVFGASLLFLTSPFVPQAFAVCPDPEDPCELGETCCGDDCCADVCCEGVCCEPGQICCSGICKDPWTPPSP